MSNNFLKTEKSITKNVCVCVCALIGRRGERRRGARGDGDGDGRDDDGDGDVRAGAALRDMETAGAAGDGAEEKKQSER